MLLSVCYEGCLFVCLVVWLFAGFVVLLLACLCWLCVCLVVLLFVCLFA